MNIKEGVHAGAFILSEANGTRSREQIVISAGSGRLAAGTLISKITAANAITVTAKVGNTGNGTVGATAVISEAATGAYLVIITEPAANGGKFEVINPSGQLVGHGVVGAAFVGEGLTFTLSDGSTDFIAGDGFTLAVKGGLGEWTPYDDDGTDDGRRTAGGILYAPVDASLVDVTTVAVARDAEVVERLLVGLDAAGRADLLAQGIVIRP